MQTVGFIFSLFVSGYELEGLLLVCYVRQGGSWRWMVKHKEDKKNRRLNEDKRRDSKEKKEGCQVEESAIFGW